MSYVKKGDLVFVGSGKDRGKTGKVLKVLSSEKAVIVQGINLITKHQRKRSQEQPGGRLKAEAAISLSKVTLYCSKCKKGVKVKINKIQNGKKQRICKKCQAKL